MKCEAAGYVAKIDDDYVYFDTLEELQEYITENGSDTCDLEVFKAITVDIETTIKESKNEHLCSVARSRRMCPVSL